MRREGKASDRHAGHSPSRVRPWRKPSRNSPIPAFAPPSRNAAGDALPSAWEPAAPSSLKSRFDALAAQWRQETEFASAPGVLFMHPAYQEIIGLGPAVVPLILQDLAETSDHWFWALRAITGADPVPPEERGYVERMAERWLQWGRAAGLP